MQPKLTLGPIAYHWAASRKVDFYAQIADEAPIDTVYLGETICSKRAPFVERDLPKIIDRLEAAGKQVVLCSLAEIMLPRERKATADLAELEDIEIEINNAAGLYARGRRSHRIGPFFSAYNEATIQWMASQGATHICLPVELPAPALKIASKAALAESMGVEVMVFGRVSLAVSARCYHARAYGRTKDNCRFVCEEHDDGMPLATRDGKPILRINGIQTQSESYLNLLAETENLSGFGVTHFRLMPQAVDMTAVATVFQNKIDGVIDLEEADNRLAQICLGCNFSNGFFHGTAGYRKIQKLAEGV